MYLDDDERSCECLSVWCERNPLSNDVTIAQSNNGRESNDVSKAQSNNDSMGASHM